MLTCPDQLFARSVAASAAAAAFKAACRYRRIRQYAAHNVQPSGQGRSRTQKWAVTANVCSSSPVTQALPQKRSTLLSS